MPSYTTVINTTPIIQSEVALLMYGPPDTYIEYGSLTTPERNDLQLLVDANGGTLPLITLELMHTTICSDGKTWFRKYASKLRSLNIRHTRTNEATREQKNSVSEAFNLVGFDDTGRIPAGTSRNAVIEASWQYPGIGRKFNQAILGLPKVEDIVFGTTAPVGTSSVAKAIRDMTSLAVDFRPLEGEFSSTGQHLGGTGPTTINSEPQRYVADFNGGLWSFPTSSSNHVFETDGLRLQATVGAGEFNSYLRGSVLTSGGGFNSGAEGYSTVTAVADIGITSGDLANIEIGTCAVAPSGGLCVVTAKNAGAGTITFESVSCGIRTAYKGNWHITFTKFAFSRVAADVVNNVTTTITFKTPVASVVVPGMYSMGVDCNAGQYFNDPSSADRAKVLSISGDRLSVTFDRPVHYGSRTLEAANADGVLFVPALDSGQIWSKKSYGPHVVGNVVTAIRVEFTAPAMPHYNQTVGKFTKTDIEAAMATVPGTMWGYWPAIWLYLWRPGTAGNGINIVSGNRSNWAEIDILELFVRVNNGQSQWTGNLHDQPYTRKRSVTNSANTSRISGAVWNTSATTNKELTANALVLGMSSSIASGTKRSVAVLYTKNKVIHYIDDLPVCESDWSVDVDYPHQLGLNVACGSLTSGNLAGLFFPQAQSDATGQYLKIHKIETWEV